MFTRCSYILITVPALQLVLCAGAQAKTDDSQNYALVSTSSTGFTQLSTPSTNYDGDVVFRGTNSAGTREIDAYLFADQAYQPYFIQGSNSSFVIVTPFPVINDDCTVAFARTEGSGLGSVRQRTFNFTSGGYDPSQPIAEWDMVGSTKPFRTSSVIASISNGGSVSFWNSAPGLIGTYNAVFTGSTKISNPDSAVVAKESALDINSLDQYCDGSNGGWVLEGSNFIGTRGIYRVETQGAYSTTVASANDFTTLGTRPSINDSGTVAFYGEKSDGTRAVYLGFKGQTALINTTQYGTMPNSISNAVDKIAINKYNQVAYLGTNASGKQAIFSTNLGATREIVSQDTLIGGSLVTGLRIWNGIMDSGQLVYLATTADGNQHVMRTTRAYTQAKLLDVPSAMSNTWWDSKYNYLLGTNGHKYKAYGCNLTSTLNALSYYGDDVTPAAMQDWLLLKYNSASATQKSHYITSDNDFQESAITEYTQEQVNQGKATTIVTSHDFIPKYAGDNRAELIAELRAGNPVKLRVPSHENPIQPFGHFVLAYALVDPTKSDSAITTADVLIHDPGNGGLYTLHDYEHNFGYDTSRPNWLDDGIPVGNGLPKPRLRIYEGSASAQALPWVLNISVFSPIDLVLTDPSGKRVGVDSAGSVIEEIAGAQYYHEETYWSLDDGSSMPEAAWGTNEIKHVYLPTPLAGGYSLEVTGTGSGHYEILFDTLGLIQSDTQSLSGDITTGEKITYNFTVSNVPEPSTVMLLGISIIGLLVKGWRRLKQRM
jgi:hypothetical protein